MVNLQVLMSQPMYLMSSCIVPSVASLQRESTSVQVMGSLLARGQNRRCSAKGNTAYAFSTMIGKSSDIVIPSSRYPSVFDNGILSRKIFVGRAGWYGMWSGSRSGGGISCWLGKWVRAGFQNKLAMRSLLRSKKTSDARQNFVGAGDELNGRWRRVTARFRTTEIQAAAILAL
eukprot:14035906-Ditylum_brightwellii.AAC.1